MKITTTKPEFRASFLGASVGIVPLFQNQYKRIISMPDTVNQEPVVANLQIKTIEIPVKYFGDPDISITLEFVKSNDNDYICVTTGQDLDEINSLYNIKAYLK